MKNNQHEASQIIKKLLDDIVVKQDKQAYQIDVLYRNFHHLHHQLLTILEALQGGKHLSMKKSDYDLLDECDNQSNQFKNFDTDTD